MKDLVEHINNLFNVDNPELVDASGLTRKDVHKLSKVIKQTYPGRYMTGISVEVEENGDVYALSVRKR